MPTGARRNDGYHLRASSYGRAFFSQVPGGSFYDNATTVVGNRQARDIGEAYNLGVQGGLCFEILTVEPEKIYEHRGRIQRKTGHINRELFHHPDAVRIPESVFSGFVGAFRMAHARFNYYGPTEYQREDISRLCNELRATIGAAPTSGCCQVEGEPHNIVESIIAIAEQALSKGQSLLVFGI